MDVKGVVTVQNTEIKKVYIIFKTHLDLGFTDYAQAVAERFIEDYIPNAVSVGYELRHSGTPFIWTVGAWMMNEALKRENPALERAIEDGVICWHGLPFTTHTELMSPRLFEYGLSISQKLDKRFGKRTVAAKMTDVPGHTIGIVPYLERAGIQFLHIGVNPATPVPDVPRLFRWKCGQSSIIVMYQGDYGETDMIGDTAFVFAHTGDNTGPQRAEEVIRIYREAAETYPNAEITAGTLNDLAETAAKQARDIPVIENEIGDSWIHGAAADPQKVSQYRALLRYIDKNGIGEADLTDNLLLVPEHTWGMDAKLYYHDKENFTCGDLERNADKSRIIERSWQEQRDYVAKAEAVLGVQADYDVSVPDLTGYEKKDDIKCGVEISWQLFDKADYARWKNVYMRLFDEWCIWDFTRVGLPDYTGGIFTAKAEEAYCKGDSQIFVLRFEEAVQEKFGLPYFVAEKQDKQVTVKWFGKKKSRLPQAFWLKFTGLEEAWEVNKLGCWIKPENIIGSPLLTAVYKGIRNNSVFIESLDAPLAAPYGRNLLNYNLKNPHEDLYFNLYNNVWNTNFPLWYDDDALFRFRLQEKR